MTQNSLQADSTIIKIYVLVLGLLVTGGGTEEVELYNPVSKTSCALPAIVNNLRNKSYDNSVKL